MKINIHLIWGTGAWLTLLVAACTPEAEQAPPSPTKQVAVVAAERVNFQREVFATGMLSLSKEVKLSFKTGGIIERIQAEEGQVVKAGQTLATLKLQEVNSQVANARLQYEKAQRDLERTQALFADSVATLEQLQNAQTQLRAAENTLESANFNLRYSRITAPYAGVVLRRLANENELVGAGTPIFLLGAKSQQKVLTVNLTAREIGAVTVGNVARVEFDALEGKVFPGKVTEKSEIADPQTNTFSVDLRIDDPENQLYSGFVGKAYVASSAARQLIRIPIDALSQASQRQASVYTLEGGVAHQKSVQIVTIQEQGVLIDSGLQPGAQVIVEGVGYLQDGDSVEARVQNSTTSAP